MRNIATACLFLLAMIVANLSRRRSLMRSVILLQPGPSSMEAGGDMHSTAWLQLLEENKRNGGTGSI